MGPVTASDRGWSTYAVEGAAKAQLPASTIEALVRGFPRFAAGFELSGGRIATLPAPIGEAPDGEAVVLRVDGRIDHATEPPIELAKCVDELATCLEAYTRFEDTVLDAEGDIAFVRGRVPAAAVERLKEELRVAQGGALGAHWELRVAELEGIAARFEADLGGLSFRGRYDRDGDQLELVGPRVALETLHRALSELLEPGASPESVVHARAEWRSSWTGVLLVLEEEG